MAERDWSGGRSPAQNRRLARAPERKEEPKGAYELLMEEYEAQGGDYRPDLYQYGGDSLLGKLLPIQRRIITPESQFAEFTGYDDRGRPMYDVTTTPAELGPVERGPGVVQRALGGLRNLYRQTKENPMGVVSGVDKYIREQADAAAAGGRTWDPETQQMTEFDPLGIPGMAMGAGYALSEPVGGAVAGMAVKNKGGNWLKDTVEGPLRQIKGANTLELENVGAVPQNIVNEFLAGADPTAYGAHNVEDFAYDLQEHLRTNYPDVYAAAIPPHKIALDKWIDTKLNKYIKNEMGTPEDPMLELADSNRRMHFNPEGGLRSLAAARRAREKFPLEGYATTPRGIDWERRADASIIGRSADFYLGSKFGNNPLTREANPWLEKIDPKSRVYSFTPTDTDLSFYHLVDELKNAIDPNTTLPQHLRIDPNKLDRMTVPQISEKVGDINAWRAEEAAKAEREGMLGNLQAAPRLEAPNLNLSFVDEPGGKWVDIPDTSKDGMPICTSIGKAGGWCTQGEYLATQYGSGENRLTALLDAEGRPHVQAMISTAEPYGSRIVSPEPTITELKPVENSLFSARSKEYTRRDPQYKEKIIQSVLDFLNAGEWGRVNDLDYYGIIDTKNTRFPGPRFVTEDQWEEFNKPRPERRAKGGMINAPTETPANYSKGRWRLI